MKKIILAASLLLAICSAPAQTTSANNSGNDHGQNDCQCIGIGIPNPSGGNPAENTAQTSVAPSASQQLPQTKVAVTHSLIYTYFQIYLWEMRMPIHNKAGN